MPTRRSSFGAACAHCGKELIAPERSEYRDERHVRHIWRCPKCNRSFEVIWSADTKSVTDISTFLIALSVPYKPQGRDGKTHHHNYDGRASDTELLCPSRWRWVQWRAKTSTEGRQANRADAQGG
jgi:hypothetical protein